jgi:group I intron endonuclease
MTGGVYCFTDHRGKRYVGSSWKMSRRKTEHIRMLNQGKHHNKRLQGAWSKYGPECFSYSVLEVCERDALRDREQYWIDTLRPWFNLTYSATAPMAGRNHSAETCAQMSKTRTGKRLNVSNEERAARAIRIAQNRPNMKGNKLRLGIRHTEESKRKMIASRTGKKRGPYNLKGKVAASPVAYAPQSTIEPSIRRLA